MAMQALRNGASGGILKFFLFGLLALAAGGLVFTDVGGFFRGGVSSNDVAKVAGQGIPLQSFDRTLSRNLSQLGITPQQAYTLGYTQEILNGDIRRRLLVKAAHDYGIMVDKKHVIEQIQTILAPALISGANPDQALANLLRSQGMSEGELINAISSERAFTILANALQSSASAPNTLISKDLYQFQNETRDIQYITFANKDYKTDTAPSDEQLNALYAATKETFSSPEMRELSVITLDVEQLKSSLSISDEDLNAAYEDNIEDYTTPAQRTIEQIIFNNQEAAQSAYEAITGGAKTFKTTQKDGDFIPAKSFSANNILTELKTPVFEAAAKGLIAPVESPLGWSLINIKAIKAETVKPFDDVKATLKDDLAEDSLIDELYTLIDEIDEFFIAGGAVENALTQFPLSANDIKPVNAFGQTKDKQQPLNDILGNNTSNTLDTAFGLNTGDTSELTEIDGGKFAAIHVKSITPKTYKPFDDVKDTLKKRWIADQRNLGNKTKVISILKDSSDTPIKDIANAQSKSIKTQKALKRDNEKLPASIDKAALSKLFRANQNEVIMLESEDAITLAAVSAIKTPSQSGDENLDTINASQLSDLENENFILFIERQREKYGAKINQALLERAYGSTADEGY